MSTKIAFEYEDGAHIVSASNAEDNYIIWQKDQNHPNQIYFEYNDQINSGDGIVTECMIDMDGCHMVLNDGYMVHFYWNPPRPAGLDKFVEQLQKIYSHNPSIISYII